MEEKCLVLARRVMEACYSGTAAAEGGGQADLQEGIPSVFLKLMPTLQAMASSTEPLVPLPCFIPGLEVNMGKVVPQKLPKPGDESGSLTRKTEAKPASSVNLEDSLGASATNNSEVSPEAKPASSVNPEDSLEASATIDSEDPPEDKDDLVFSKVVEDTRRKELGIVARYKNCIVRLECLGGGKICVQIYERDVHCGYYDELEFTEHCKSTLETGDTIYGEYSEYFKCKLFDYLKSQKGECVFDKIVHDRRHTRNHLLAKEGDLIISYGLDTRQYEVFTDKNELYPYMDGLVQSFYPLDDWLYPKEVKAIKKQLQLYKIAHGLLKSPSTSNLFIARQVPVTIYTKEDEIFGSEWK